MSVHHKPGGVAASQRTAAVAAALGGVMLVCLAVVLARHAEQASPLLGGLISPRWHLAQLAGNPGDCLLCAPAEEADSRGAGDGAGLGGVPASAGTGAGSRAPVPPPPPPPHCSLNALLDRKHVRWSKANGTADRLTVRDCTLRRYSATEARRCLAGKRLVFVGDSVTRYQYLTLLHFLDKREWPAPHGGVPGQPSVANEHEWPSWNDFLRGTSALFGGRELCDCYREDYDPSDLTYRPPEDEKHENRFYTLPTPAGNVSVVHLTFTTHPNKVHGHFGFPPYPHLRQPCAPATCSAPADWAHHLPVALKGPVRGLAPTHLVLNTGLWGPASQVPGWRAIARAGRRAVEAQGGRVIWRTTTATRPIARRRSPHHRPPIQPDHDDVALAALLPAGWEVMDAFALTRPLTRMRRPPLWDGRHFLAVVYRELNLYLLNLICETEGGSSSSSSGIGGSSGNGGGSSAAEASAASASSLGGGVGMGE